MKLIIGLGNPGLEYEETRHNVGFLVLDWYVGSVLRLPWKKEKRGFIAIEEQHSLIFLKPRTFMNRSGVAVAEYLKKANIDDARNLLVISDDADLMVGDLRLRERGSDGGHRGLRSIIEVLQTSDFPRLRFGVGRPEDPSQNLADHVLDPFSPSEIKIVHQLIEKSAKVVDCWCKEGYLGAAQIYSQLTR